MIFRSITLVSCGVIGGWLGYMASDRQTPVKYYSAEVVNEPKPGETLRLAHIVWRDRSCKSTIHRLIFDSSNRRHVIPDLEFPAGILPVGHDAFIAPIPIPLETSPGHAIYRVHREYRCNPTHWLFPIEDGPRDIQFTVATK